MFSRLTIKNYQAHKSLVIDLDPHITTIIGPSDIGKSAVLRALRWICLNDPKGAAFIRNGAESAHVKLEVDSHTISRRRSKSLNQYTLDGDDLRAFKNGVPQSVQKVLNVSDLNFQRQHDAPFWFSLSAPQVSREINQIVNLEVIDTIQSKIAARVRKAKATVEVTRDRLKQAKKRKKELEWVRKCNGDLRRLERQQERLETVAKTRDSAAALLEQAERASELIEKHGSTIAKAQQRIAKLDRVAAKLERVAEQRDRLVGFISSLEKETKQWQRVRTEASVAAKRLRKMMRTCPLCGKRT